MHDRLKSIKSIAKAIKLRLPFEPGNDNMHDLLDAIVSLCDEPFEPALTGLENAVTTITMTTDAPGWFRKLAADKMKQKPSVAPGSKEYKELFLGNWNKDDFRSNETTRVKAYLINEMWLVVGIPKRQPFHEQVFWCANKGATKIKMEHDGEESEVLISQIKQQ